MKRLIRLASHTLRPAAFACSVLALGTLAGCSGARLSHDEVRKQITEIGTSSLVPGSIQVQRIISNTDKDAIAETTVAMAFAFKKDKASGPWRITAARLGDRDWIGVDELIAAVNDIRRRTTQESLQKLVAGIAAYRQQTGAAPNATDIVGLTNILHPMYMPDLVRTDAWGRPLHYDVSGGSYRLSSNGADGIRGTADDILLTP